MASLQLPRDLNVWEQRARIFYAKPECQGTTKVFKMLGEWWHQVGEMLHTDVGRRMP